MIAVSALARALPVICGAACVAAAQPAPRPAQGGKAEVTWGKPVEGQAISITAPKLAYACGEPIALNIRLKNVGSVAVFDPRERVRHSPLYRFDVRLAGGAAIAELAGTWGPRKPADFAALPQSRAPAEGTTIEPGTEIPAYAVLNRAHDMSRPGKYVVSARRNVVVPGGGLSPAPAVSNTLEITVADVVAEQLKVQANELKHRRALDFRNTWVTDAALGQLEGLTELRELRLFGAENITDAGLEHVGRLRALERLDLTATNITDAGLAHLVGLAGLRSLALDSDAVTDAGLEHVRGLTELRALSLRQTNVTGAGLRVVEGLAKLESLELYRTRIGDAALAHLRPLANLKCVELDVTDVGDAGLAHLGSLAKIERLGLARTRATDAGLAHLKGLANLQSLNLNGTRVTDAGLAHLMGLARLNELCLGGTKVTDAGLASVKGMANLGELYVDEDAVTDAGLENLRGLTKLTTLSLAGTQVGDAGLGRLTALTNLGWIDVSRTRVTAEGVEKLRKALPKCVINYTPGGR
jgi:hypothetical protein